MLLKSFAMSTYIGTFVNLPGLFVFFIIGFLMFLLYTFQFIYTYKTMVEEEFLIRSKMQFFLLYLVFFIPGSFEAFICVFLFFKKSQTVIQILIGLLIFLLFLSVILSGVGRLSDFLTDKLINRKDSQIKIATDIREHSTKVTKIENKLIGSEYILKAPMFLLKNLPRGPRTNIVSVYVAPNSLVSFRNPILNLLDHERIESVPRLEFLPIGSRLKIVGAFELLISGLLDVSRTTYLIVEDEKKNQAEISEIGFKVDVVSQKGENFDYDQPLMNYINTFKEQNKLELTVCDSSARNLDDDEGDAIDDSKYIEVRLLRFLKDFKLLETVDISKIGYGIDQKRMYSCVKIHFKILEPLFLYYYYGHDWGLFTKFVDGSGKIIKRIGEFQNFNYQEAKGFSDHQLEHYKRYDGFKKLEDINQNNYILPVVEPSPSDKVTPADNDNNEPITLNDLVKEASEKARLIMIEKPNNSTKPLEVEKAQ